MQMSRNCKLCKLDECSAIINILEKESAQKRRFVVLYQGKQSQLKFAVEPLEESKQLLQLSITEFRRHLTG